MARLSAGAVPFREFMEAALHDPDTGYYSSRIRTVGRRGDFSTAATLSAAPAAAIARWILSERSRLPGPILHLIEIGPGDGSLHRDVRRALGWRGRLLTRSHLVERSPGLRDRQRETLGRDARRIAWHDHPASALEAAGGCAILFSNELVDAFPVTLLERTADGWQEVHVAFRDGTAVESLRPAGHLPASSIPDLPFPAGQRVEIHESYRQWMQSWLPAWRCGAMLTIDYGAPADRLYHRRPRGSLRGYRHHQLLDTAGIYALHGRCDITADVNFTDLCRWGEADGLATVSLETLSSFLRRHLPDGLPADPAGDALASPHGAGDAFLCLVQHRGIPP